VSEHESGGTPPYPPPAGPPADPGPTPHPERFAPPGQEVPPAGSFEPLVAPKPGDQPAQPHSAPYAQPDTEPDTRPPAGPPAGPEAPADAPALALSTPQVLHPVGEPLTEPAAPPARGRPSGWMWPAVTALALVVGGVGGYLGGTFAEPESTEPTATVQRDSGPADPAPLPKGNDDIAKVAETMLPSTVQIFAEAEDIDKGSTGSGFILDDRGHVVTNNHVVADSASDDGPVSIVDQDGNEYTATVVGTSAVYDLAVLDVPEIRGALTPSALGASDEVIVGQTVVAIGAPLGLNASVTSGIVSALHRPVSTGDSQDSASYIDAVQTDAAINPGNSGGPLVNLNGQVVGVNSAIASSGMGSGGNIGVGFAIPIDQVKVTTAQILKDGFATYPVMGADVDTRPSTSGARITAIRSGSAAARAGVRENDTVIRIGDQRVTDGVGLIVAIRSHQPGDKVDLTLERAGRERTVAVTLDAQRE